METLIKPLYEDEVAGRRADPDDVANVILSEGALPLFAQKHGGNGSPYVDSDLIRYHFGCTWGAADQARKLLVQYLDDDELREAAREDASP